MNRLISLLIGLVLSGVQIANAQAPCSMQLSHPALDFGAYSADPWRAPLTFGPRRVQLQVQCAEPQSLRLHFDAPSVDGQRYRFGAGSLQVQVLSAQVDGQASRWSSGPDGADTLPSWRPGQPLQLVLPGRHLHLELEIEPTLDGHAAKVRDISLLRASGRFRLE